MKRTGWPEHLRMLAILVNGLVALSAVVARGWLGVPFVGGRIPLIFPAILAILALAVSWQRGRT